MQYNLLQSIHVLHEVSLLSLKFKGFYKLRKKLNSSCIDNHAVPVHVYMLKKTMQFILSL